MTMVAAVVVSATRSGLTMWKKGGDHVQTLRRSRTVLDILNDQIRGAMPLTYTVRTADRITNLLAFDGNRVAMRFVSRTSFKDGPDGIPHWVDLRWSQEPQNSAGELVIEERRILSPDNAADPTVSWHGSILEARSCLFDYLLNGQNNKPAIWLGEWHYPTNTALPKAVRMSCISVSKGSIQLLIPLDYFESSRAGMVLR
jgi:hypothetical protein